jgi:hypothetical protein
MKAGGGTKPSVNVVSSTVSDFLQQVRESGDRPIRKFTGWSDKAISPHA